MQTDEQRVVLIALDERCMNGNLLTRYSISLLVAITASLLYTARDVKTSSWRKTLLLLCR